MRLRQHRDFMRPKGRLSEMPTLISQSEILWAFIKQYLFCIYLTKLNQYGQVKGKKLPIHQCFGMCVIGTCLKLVNICHDLPMSFPGHEFEMDQTVSIFWSNGHKHWWTSAGIRIFRKLVPKWILPQYLLIDWLIRHQQSDNFEWILMKDSTRSIHLELNVKTWVRKGGVKNTWYMIYYLFSCKWRYLVCARFQDDRIGKCLIRWHTRVDSWFHLLEVVKQKIRVKTNLTT